MEQYCTACNERLGKGGDTYFLSEEKTKVTNVLSYVSYDLDVDGQVVHFQVESTCGACQAQNVYRIDYTVE